MVSSVSSLDLQGGIFGVSDREFPNKVFTFESVQFYLRINNTNNKYLEESIFTSLETGALTIVHQDGGVINHRHLRETLLRVQEHVDDGKDANCDEGTNHNVVLEHLIVLLL
jgi:hypothetical protein